MKKEENIKKHADFQDSYRRSSNFNSSIKNEDFKIMKNGELALEDEDEANTLDQSEKERIQEAVDGVRKHK